MSTGVALFLELLRGEGARALGERIADHLHVARAGRRFARVDAEALPRAEVLHVSATAPAPWLGGVAAQLVDRLPEDERLAPTALLFPWRGRLRLQVAAEGRGAWALLPQTVGPTPAPDDAAWGEAVRAAMRLVGARLLHVDGVAGLPQATLLAIAREHPTLLSLHDFALFCPRPNLYDELLGRGCGACADAATCASRLAACGRAEAPLAATWRTTGGELLASAAAVVYPSPFLRAAHERLFGTSGPAAVVPPGIPFTGAWAARDAASAPPAATHAPRVVFVGGGAPHKGAELLVEVVREWRRRRLPPIDWHVLGGGGGPWLRVMRRAGVHVHGYYRHGTLPRRLRALDADLVLLLPRVPETFSLALSEAAVASVPVLAAGSGALVKRLDGIAGALLPEEAGVEDTIAALSRWRAGGPPRQPPAGRVPRPAQAAAALHALHLRLLGNAEASRAAAAPFAYRRESGDALRRGLGLAERVVTGIGRWARGRASVAELRRASRARGGERGMHETTPGGAPVLYLPALPWSYRFQRPQQLARALVRAGHPVLYVEGFRRARWQPRRVLEPGAVARLRLAIPGRPDPYREELAPDAVAGVAAMILDGLRARPLAILAQLPFWAPVALRLREELGVPLVYDRIDFHLGFPGVPASFDQLEAQLMAGADLVLASSPLLREGCQGIAARATLVPNAVALDDFAASARSFDGAVILGYVGALADWFDADAIESLAAARPEWSLRLAGRVESAAVERLGRLRNVELLGEIPYDDVPRFLAGLHALLVPFLDLPLTRAVDPVKLYEGLAAGLPVISRRLPAVERWPEPLVYVYDDGGLEETVERALTADDAAAVAWRRQVVREETWERRAEQVLALIRETTAD